MRNRLVALCRRTLLFCITALIPLSLFAEETAAQRDQRMKWWRDAKFGLFIHWGVYAVPAGIYKGEPVKGIGEWIMRNAEIPVTEYRAFAKQFNPIKYQPEAWAKLAREAGMRYVVITSKHHDGFALFPTAVSDWDVVDATPYGKDLLAPLAKAVRKQGLKFGCYYSQSQDWTNPGGAKARLKEGEGWDERHKGDYDDYLKKIAVPQTREILTRYPLDILWWDTPVWMTAERAAPLYALLALRPGIITNNRLGGGYSGDTDTPEQHIPATGIPGRDWEVCMTMNDTWGYKSDDHNWKSTKDLIQKLADIVSKGGNFLLNVGPTAEGEIPLASVQRLKAIGSWMKVNRQAIYGTTASPFHKLVWGRCTKKIHANGTTLYLHVFDWPQDGQLVLPGLKNSVKSARVLATGQTATVVKHSAGVLLKLAGPAPDPINSIVVVEIDGEPEVESNMPVESAEGMVDLPAEMADIHNPGYGEHATLSGKGAETFIANWQDNRAKLNWVFKLQKPGRFRIEANMSCGTDSSRFSVKLAGNTLEVAVRGTDDLQTFRWVNLGEIPVVDVQNTVLQIIPDAKKWQMIHLKSLRLIRVG